MVRSVFYSNCPFCNKLVNRELPPIPGAFVKTLTDESLCNVCGERASREDVMRLANK